MSLVDIYESSRDQLSGKQVEQVIRFAGGGRLKDGSDASTEFRQLLSVVPLDWVSAYAGQCLTEPFQDSGLALQDVVNELGRRLRFNVEHGRYRGTAGQSGHDGIWRSETGHALVVEVKTTDAYNIRLDTVDDRRRVLAKENRITIDDSSTLIVVGRQDTGSLEAQIRGSRQAWETRIVGVDALLKLAGLATDEFEYPDLYRVTTVLMPREFTRVDGIIELVFFAAEEVVGKDDMPDEDADPGSDTLAPKVPRSAFQGAVADRVASQLSKTLVKQSRSMFAASDGSLQVACLVSRRYGSADKPRYWFGYHPYQEDELLSAPSGFIAFGCGSPELIFLIPVGELAAWKQHMNITDKPGSPYWHVHIDGDSGAYSVRLKPGFSDPALGPFTL